MPQCALFPGAKQLGGDNARHKDERQVGGRVGHLLGIDAQVLAQIGGSEADVADLFTDQVNIRVDRVVAARVLRADQPPGRNLRKVQAVGASLQAGKGVDAAGIGRLRSSSRPGAGAVAV